MTTKELIVELEKMPQGADVKYFWDGCARTLVEAVYVSNVGDVVLNDGYKEYGYDDGDYPKGLHRKDLPDGKGTPIPCEVPSAGYGSVLELPTEGV